MEQQKALPLEPTTTLMTKCFMDGGVAGTPLSSTSTNDPFSDASDSSDSSELQILRCANCFVSLSDNIEFCFFVIDGDIDWDL
jgi:hypothetical protein